jgi:hypothetical protein
MNKKMKNILFFLALFVCAPFVVNAQTYFQNSLPKISPGSPEQASIAKFGNYKVNLFTGLPDISIPLYEIKCGELTLPISISYHASGIKVNDCGSWVGIGWSLNAGASITRKVMGLPDEMPGNYLHAGFGQTVRDATTISTTNQNDLDYLSSVNRGSTDVEPDIFSYNLPGKGGSFLFNQKDNYKPIIIPFDPIKIDMPSTTEFKLTDEGGVLYDFNDGEGTSSSSNGTTTNYQSAWVITQIQSANRQDAINFSYDSRWGDVSEDIEDYVSVSDNVQNYNIYQSSPVPPLSSQVNIDVWTSEKKIKEITFTNGKVDFIPSVSDREDGYTGQKLLSSIEIYNKDVSTGSYKLIKKIIFHQTYFTNGVSDHYNKRLKLNSIDIQDNNNNTVETYSFDYNTSINLPSKKLSRSRDFWGYYNNKSNNTLVPRQQYYMRYTGGGTPIYVGSNVINGRDPDPNFMQACMLETIHYPTGGHTDFEFETNQYKDEGDNTLKYAGGLRIKTIKSYDGISNQPIVKTYNYGDNECGWGRANFQPPLQHMAVPQHYQYIDYLYDQYGQAVSACMVIIDSKDVTTFNSYPSLDIEPYDGSPVAYRTVTEYTGDGTNNTGKTIYEFRDHVDAMDNWMTNLIFRPIVNTYHQDRGQVAHEAVYRKNDDGTYYKLSETYNTYQAFSEQWYNKVGLGVFKKVLTFTPLGLGEDADNPVSACVTDQNSYNITNYNIRSSDDRLTQTINTVYDENNSSKFITTTTNYAYGNFAHMLPTTITATNSKGETITTTKKYVSDESAAPYTTMGGLHILDKVVEENASNGSTPLTPLSYVNNVYADQSNNNFLPSNIKYQLGSNPVETRAIFNNYDARGNILDMQKSDDIHMGYEWGYNNMYPVAEVINAENLSKEAVVNDQSFSNISLTVPASSSNSTSVTKIITVDYTGTVTITLGNGGAAETVSGSIVGLTPNGTSLNSVNLGLGCDNGSSTVFSNISSGTYTITITLNNTHPFGFCGTIHYPTFNTHTVVSGTKEFFYEGFEENNTTASTTNPAAGKRCFTGNYTVPFTKPNSRQYTIDYHLRTNNVWAPVSSTFSNNMTITVPAGDATDEIRVFPSDALMSTYTYEPLIGITSKCDINNHISYYEYDNYGRLKQIRDEDQNIIKKFDYYYTVTSGRTATTACSVFNCSGNDRKCVNGSCEQGTRVNTSTKLQTNGLWRCTYHFEWSDGTNSINYSENNATPCDL